MAITRTRLKPPFNKVVVVTLLLVSATALLLLLLVPEQWPVLVSVHLVFVWALLLYPTLRPNCGWFGPVVKSFQSHSKEVWLTIDDGPHPEVPTKDLSFTGAGSDGEPIFRHWRARECTSAVGARDSQARTHTRQSLGDTSNGGLLESSEQSCEMKV